MTSIIIVHYNTFDLTYACVASCYKYITSDFEMILVDNGSTEKPLTKLLSDFAKVKLIIAERNGGFSEGNKLGIEAATGEYILLLNSDCELTEDSVTKSVEQFKSKPDVGVLTCSLSFPNGEKQNNYQSFPSLGGDLLETTRLFKLMDKKRFASRYENRLLSNNQSHYCDWVWGAFFLFRKSDLYLLKEKQLNTSFFMYGEDMEWCWQFAKIGKRSFYFSETTVVHYMGQSNFGNDSKKWQTIIGNELITIKYFKGSFYSFCYRMIRSLKYLLSPNRKLAKFYFFGTKSKS